MCGTVAGSYQEAQAADLSAGALQYGLDLSFLESLFMAGGLSLGLDMLLKTQNDINNWDWGDVLDSPASQGQIDSANEKIESLYNNAVKDWYDKHGGSSKPTPTPMITEPPAPGVTPPVTVAPINPDDVTMPDDWATMKKNATDKGVLAMGAATAYCVKEAIRGWWDDLMDNTPPTTNLKGNPLSANVKDFVGKVNVTYDCTSPNTGTWSRQFYLYNTSHYTNLAFYITSEEAKGLTFYNVYPSVIDSNGTVLENWKTSAYINYYRYDTGPSNYKHDDYSLTKSNLPANVKSSSGIQSVTYSLQLYVPYSIDGVYHAADPKPLDKSSLWPSTDTKDDYNNNNSLPSPSYPNLAVPSITLPTLDEIKELWKQGSEDEENRPTYVTNFITNHTVQPTPEPEPTKKPEVNPNPGGGTDPDPKPSASPTPAVNPDPGGGTNPQPSGTPDPNPDPDNPENPTPEEEASPYKADLREIFPFCIPFDLIHLFKVFDAEPEAPVFKFPLDLELDNPWTDEKVVDYHHEFEFDFSDYEDLIKLLRIIQIVAFITGLMMITRQQMIKG